DVGLAGEEAGVVGGGRGAAGVMDGENVDFGGVGDIEFVEPRILQVLINAGYVPVVAPFTADSTQRILNTNADSVAAAVAVALKAEKLFFVLKEPGVLSDPENPHSLLPFVDLRKIRELEASCAIQTGMRPKIAPALSAL